MNLDEYDLKILDLLSRNSRLSYSEIGKILGLTRQTVKSRILKLEEEGIIQGYTIKVTLNTDRPIFFLKIKSEKKPEGFHEVYRIGKERYLVKFIAESSEDLGNVAIRYDVEEIIPVAEYFESEIPEVTRISFRCDYCGKEAFERPLTFRFHNKLYVFCCPTCLDLFKESNYNS